MCVAWRGGSVAHQNADAQGAQDMCLKNVLFSVSAVVERDGATATGATRTESNSNAGEYKFTPVQKDETLTVHFAASDHRLEPIELSDIKVDRRVAQKDVAWQLKTSVSGTVPKKQFKTIVRPWLFVFVFFLLQVPCCKKAGRGAGTLKVFR